jgi:hypothetical protein
MKRFLLYFLLLPIMFLSSCDEIVDKLTTVEVATVLTESFNITFEPNSEEPFTLNHNFDFNLADSPEIADNLDKVDKVKIKSVRYRFRDFEGNEDALLDAAFVFIQRNVVINLEQIEVKNEADHQSVHTLPLSNDQIAELETLFNNFDNHSSLNGTIAVTGHNIPWNVNLDIMFMLSVESKLKSN